MPLIKIVSRANPHVKNTVALRSRWRRTERGVILIEGLRECLSAKSAGVQFKEIFICPELITQKTTDAFWNLPSFQKGLAVFETTPEVYEKMAFGDRRDGLLAVAIPPEKSFNDLRQDILPLLLIIDDIEKPGNLGAILRTCDAVGASGVIVCLAGVDLYNPHVIRASLGSVFTVPVVTASDHQIRDYLKVRGIPVCALQPESQKVYTEINWNSPLAVVLGREDLGVSPFWQEHADLRVSIPMKGQMDSLNVSVTAGIILYEAYRQRNVKSNA